MTETIGWGDIDVDVAPPGRRRVRGAVLWATVLAVVAGIAVAPTARARLAGSAAVSLAHAWAVAKAYDVTRAATEERALDRAAPGDRARYRAVVALTDREEAAHLRRLARDVAARHTWAPDVHAAAVAVRRALDAEAGDLDADASRAATTFRIDLYLATPTQAATQSLQATAQRAIDRLTSRHHIHVRVRPAEARLTAATPVLAVLNRLTTHPVNVRLAVSHDGGLDLFDLATGSARTYVARAADDSDYDGPLMRFGDGALFATDQGLRLVRSDGTSHRIGIAAPVEYLSAGDGTVWAATYGLWRHYDGTGRPVGASYAVPGADSVSVMAATANSLVVLKANPYTETQSVFVWTPSTGRVVPVEGACDGAVTGSRDAIAYVGCDQRSLSVMDIRTGRVHRLSTPAGTVVDEAAMTLSPDGSRLAFRATPLNGDDSGGSLVVFDTRTGHATVVAPAAVPMSWSPDGAILLVNTDVGDSLFSMPLAYWTDGMDQPEPVRVPLPGQSVSAVLLP